MKPGIYFRPFLLTLTLSFILLFNACSDTNVGPALTNMEMSYVSSTDGLTDGNFQIDSVKILIKDIRFGIDSDTNTLTNFRVATHILYLNMTNTVRFISDAYVPPATYTRASFEVHQVASNETAPDPDFSDANGRYSLVVMGSYNGSQFKFKSQLDARTMLMFLTPVTITTDVVTNVTLRFSPYKWFISGGTYLDPTASVNTPLINSNIQGNINGGFSIFRDANKDGNPD